MPAIPFNLRVFGISWPSGQGQMEVEAQTVVNEATNEQFSVSERGSIVEVKRSRAPKIKEKNSQNS